MGFADGPCSYSKTVFASSIDGTAESEFGSNQLRVFEVAHEALA